MAQPILILGAGINGAALARELAINGLSVCLVDKADLSAGATAYSSRLIHGGLRYLEYGEYDLVRESLAERGRLLQLVPEFVKPLRLYIPVERRRGGLLQSAARFVGLERLAVGPPKRGLWMIQAGLVMYDLLARDATLPRHRTERVGSGGCPPVNPRHYRWLCSYSDAQIQYPERFVVALLADARAAARERGVEFEFFNYSTAELQGRTATVRSADGAELRRFEPAAIINATGAWVDRTLAALHITAPRLMGGTKGSHLVVRSTALRGALTSGGLYAEAADGRPVFVLPFGELSLVGTTDIPFDGDPAAAVASAEEVDYLISTVNRLLPEARVIRDEVLLHYSGVRPLPAANPSRPAAITRRHWMQEQPDASVPTYSIIGGKLTTCRSLAEDACNTLFARLGLKRQADTRDRPIRPTIDIAVPGAPGSTSHLGQVIREEWVARLDDLVERRLMLLYDPSLSRAMLVELAKALVAEGRLAASNVNSAVDSVVDRLRTHFGRIVA
ncbi:MAG TPA: FAD-dependent oxidoreductase [Pirellulales bacterium]|nr:FAD-dependent oxidoreductase [Pirellulales bacterium]